MSNILKMLCRGGEAAYVVDAADFDGTNDYVTRGAGLTGAADSKLFTFMQWFRMDAADGTQLTILNGSTAGAFTGMKITRQGADNKFRVLGRNAAGTNIVNISTTTAYTQSATWKCLMGSFDLADTAKRHLYVGDTSDLTVTTYTNDTLNFTTQDQWVYGADEALVNKLNMAVAEGAYWFGQYLDLSVESNRRKLYSATGKPANIGTAGATPTGTAAIMYFHLDDGEAVANFATNRGTGGNFSITGALDVASTSPSD